MIMEDSRMGVSMEIPKTDTTSIYRINNTHVVAKDIHAAIKLYNLKYPYETVTKVDLIDNFAIIKNEESKS